MHSAEASRARSSLAERYRVLLDIGRRLTGTLTKEDLYRAIYEETAQVLEASGFFISLYNPEQDLATVVFYADRGQERRPEISYRGSDSEVIRTGVAAVVEDRVSVRSLLLLGEDESSEVTRSAVSAALRHKGQVLGVISAQSYRPAAYGSEDLELLQGIADIAAVALENAHFVAELDRQRKEAEQIEEIGRALTSSLDRQEVLGKVIDATLSLVRADGATVWLMEGTVGRVAASGGRIALPVGVEWDLEGPIHHQLVQERLPLVIDDLTANQQMAKSVREHLKSGSGLAVPLIVGNEVAGALSAGSSDQRSFTAEDTRVLLRIASQASVALENARLHSSLHSLSLTDPLTGLPNRRHLQMHLTREVAAARRGRDLVVVMFDLDNFKRYNDSEGHLAGDDALRSFGQILTDENRAMNLVARYGGDEFISILSESKPDGARLYIERVQERVVADPIMGPGGITVSTGLAAFDRAVMRSAEDVIQAADDCLYERKADKPSTR